MTRKTEKSSAVVYIQTEHAMEDEISQSMDKVTKGAKVGAHIKVEDPEDSTCASHHICNM